MALDASTTRRWLDVALRAVHLATIVLAGAALLGAPLDLRLQLAGVLFSGMALMAVEFLGRPELFFRWSGLSLLIKLGLVGLMLLFPAALRPLFWAVLLWSAIFAHAPSSFRHRPLGN